MLNNTLTFAVDTLNNGTITNTDFTRVESYDSGRSLYIADGHEMASRNQIQFYRTLPKPAGTFKGVARASFKITLDVEVADNEGGVITVPYILEVSTSQPVGVTSAARRLMRQKAVAILDNDSFMEQHSGEYPQY